MATVKTLVCMANSRKHSGRCVAGIELTGGGPRRWVRPVSARPGHEVSDTERRYEDGTDPLVLDVVAVPLIGPRPHGFQKENWLLDPGRRWRKVGRIGWDELLGLEQRPRTLWTNGHETYHGRNNRVPVDLANTLADSLKLIRVDGMTLQVHAPRARFGDPTRFVDAHFRYAGVEYALRVTDAVYRLAYLEKPNGRYELGESFLTVSLGESHEGYFYKLVAGVVERAKAETGGGL